MRTLWSITCTLLVILPLCATSVRADTQTTDPAAVLQAMFAALNSGDVDGAVQPVADDAVLVHIPPPPGFQAAMDKAGLRTWWTEFADRNGRIEITTLQVHGDQVAFTANISEDFFTAQGVPVMVANVVAIVQDGQLHSFTILFTKASQAIFGAALTCEMNKAAIRRNYEELWSEGNLAVADAITDPNVVNHHSGDTGTAGLKQVISLLRQAFPDLKVTINNLVAEGDLVVADVTFDEGAYQGGLPAAFGIPDSAIGKSVKIQAIDVYRFKDGKIVEAWGLSDQLSWFNQLGVVLAPPGQD